jgi:1,4-alpha-glucan branching enzyme
MVGMARPVSDGGLGFDYRLAMGIPDYWIHLLREKQDEQWNMGQLYGALTNRRAGEKHVGYAESHDQALVGDKTLAMWLMDADIYFHMNKGSRSLVVDRGIALHKLIRLVTFALGGEAYLNFMGNEFGHPEWIDFPREGNNWSFKYARRQWSLVDDPLLRYRDLNAFDHDMIALDEKYHLLGETETEHLYVHEDDKVLVFRRAGLVFAVNFHPTKAVVDYRVPVPAAADYKLVLNSDDMWYGGHGEVVTGQHYPHLAGDWSGKAQSIQLYLPPRVGLVLAAEGSAPGVSG